MNFPNTTILLKLLLNGTAFMGTYFSRDIREIWPDCHISADKNLQKLRLH